MYYIKPLELVFKDKEHEHRFFHLMGILNKPLKDREYGSLLYLIAASGKADVLKEVFDDEGVDVDLLCERMGVFSSSERSMIRFGLQLFNSRIDDIKLPDVFWSLDEDNCKVVKSVIDYRFR